MCVGSGIKKYGQHEPILERCCQGSLVSESKTNCALFYEGIGFLLESVQHLFQLFSRANTVMFLDTEPPVVLTSCKPFGFESVRPTSSVVSQHSQG